MILANNMTLWTVFINHGWCRGQELWFRYLYEYLVMT